jgi:hypothetical protein
MLSEARRGQDTVDYNCQLGGESEWNDNQQTTHYFVKLKLALSNLEDSSRTGGLLKI